MDLPFPDHIQDQASDAAATVPEPAAAAVSFGTDKAVVAVGAVNDAVAEAQTVAAVADAPIAAAEVPPAAAVEAQAAAAVEAPAAAAVEAPAAAAAVEAPAAADVEIAVQ